MLCRKVYVLLQSSVFENLRLKTYSATKAEPQKLTAHCFILVSITLGTYVAHYTPKSPARLRFCSPFLAPRSLPTDTG